MIGFYYLGIITIWTLLTLLLSRIFLAVVRLSERKITIGNILVGLIVIAWLGTSFWVAVGKKLYWDAKVLKMCAFDGGERIYGTAVLSANVYDELKKHNWMLPTAESAKPKDEYIFEFDDRYYRRENPQVLRKVIRIIRRSDGVVLGQSIRYGRIGGGIPGPGHESSFICPDTRKSVGLNANIFIRGE